MYPFKKFFLDERLNKLLNDIISIVEINMKINYINLIDENYELATKYLEEENYLISTVPGTRYMCSEFISRYQKYLQKFNEFMSLSFSDEFMETLEGYFYRIKNDILNYIKSRLKSINKYNLNDQIIKSNFFLIEKINEEINTLLQNMENIFRKKIS